MIRATHIPPLIDATEDAAGRSRVEVSPTMGRIVRDGKFLRDAGTGRKWFAKGYAYGPFAPSEPGGPPLPCRGRVASDLDQIAAGGANLIRLYHAPPTWLLDAAGERELRVMFDVPWPANPLLGGGRAARSDLVRAVSVAAKACGEHPATLAVSVANEVPAEVARYAGAAATERLLTELIDAGRSAAPGCLFTFANYPRTEYLRVDAADLTCFNVYLHDPAALRRYLARLQVVAGETPLLVSEFGLDTLREFDEAEQARRLSAGVRAVADAGAAGAVVFRHTDEWHAGGGDVGDWAFGVVRADRTPKASYAAVADAFAEADDAPAIEKAPRVSVVVCAHNAAATLGPCLASLTRLDYPDFEMVVVDDGSADDTADIAAGFGNVRLIRLAENAGLSHARNVGLHAATGEVIAYTDADCEADESWLRHLVSTLQQGDFAGVGGPNLIPAGNVVAACVARSPGGPTHVLLSDRTAEHVPGCNMAFWRDALENVGGFDARFRAAGDDVDLVWRLQDAGRTVGFAPAAQVWHHRRSSAAAYLGQQRGYGRAEALLQFKHPERFNLLGGALWRGRVYGPGRSGGPGLGRDAVNHGPMGAGLFQTLYARPPSTALSAVGSVEWHLAALFALACGLAWPAALAVALVMELASLALAGVAAWRASRAWSGPWWGGLLVAALHWLQPIVRGGSRYAERWRGKAGRRSARSPAPAMALPIDPDDRRTLRYWRRRPGPPEADAARLALLSRVADDAATAGLPTRADSGWQRWDLELYGSRLAKAHLLAAGESLAGGDLVRVRSTVRATGLCRLGLIAAATLAAVATFRLGPWGAASWAGFAALLAAQVASRRGLSSRVRSLVDASATEAGFDRVFAPERD